MFGLTAYLALLGGSAAVIEQVRRRAPPLGLGLGAVLLALIVHSVAYSGFFEDPVTWLAIAVAARVRALAGRQRGHTRRVIASELGLLATLGVSWR